MEVAYLYAIFELNSKLGERLSMRLYNHEMMSGINEIVMDILNQAARTSQAAEEMRNSRDYMFSNKALNFLQKNVDLEPPVFYAPTWYKRIEALAMVVKAWETCAPSQPRTKQAAAAPGALPSQTWDLPLIPWAWDGSFSSISTGFRLTCPSISLSLHVFSPDIASTCHSFHTAFLPPSIRCPLGLDVFIKM